MWYWGGDFGVHKFQIGYASSPDGIHWTKDALHNPVLKLGPEGAWDDKVVSTPSVLFRDSSYHMWYSGSKKTSSGGIIRIGHATSTNGVEWIKDAANNPVLDLGPAGSWDDEMVADVTVVHDGSQYNMWYTGGFLNGLAPLGHATSTDGSNWTKDSLNPVLLADESWEVRGIESAMVVYAGSEFNLWYLGGNLGKWSTGYAKSMDGINWTKDSRNPVFKGTPGTWNEKYIGATAIIDSAHIKYKMWYGGITSGNGYVDIGYACSDTRDPYLLSVTSKPVFDSTDTFIAEIVLDGTIYIVPEGTSPVEDSMIKYNLASAEALANTEVQIPLTDLSVGQYTVISVSNDGFVSTNPFSIRVVDNAALPELTLTKDTVTQEGNIVVSSDKDGTIFLVNKNTPADHKWIRSSFYFIDSLLAKANIPVEFPTAGLSDKDYWLYAVDVYKQISEADTVTVKLGVGVEENASDIIRIYPIPARELVIIETNKIGQYSIKLTSLNGQLIYSEEMEGISHQIDLSSFQKGAYFITIRSRNFVTTRKIIKL